jgi:hypothetical protein
VIIASQLLADLTRLLKRIEDDLRQRIADMAELKASLQTEWQAARDADRTAETFDTWADQVITQAGVHWLLSCVFLRFIEDNELVERPWLSGAPQSGRLALARDRHEAYFREKPLESDREYLLTAFRDAGALPGLHTFFDEVHNPVFRIGLSGDAAMSLRQFWQQVDPNTGNLTHDFTDTDWNTRFLGNLYQDLSEATRKRYALLQTPEFVEEFILDRTLTPAIREFGFREVRTIDPTSGSGHFLLGAFQRLVDEWVRHEPARNPRDIAQRALDAVAGVDLNPFAVAISRFRLLVAALKVSGVRRLSQAPDFKLNVAIGDSLLHGKRFGMTATDGMFEGAEHYAGTGLAHAYASEDLADLQRVLGRQYHAVVGNPPYIVVRDAALNAAYRRLYASCHRQYSLGCPFTERFFELAITGDGKPAGFVGLITANSFMKREFGSKLIEQVLPRLDLTHVIDTSVAAIPGHNTATVILLGRHRAPIADTVRTVMGTKGVASDADEPAQGKVWLAILSQIDHAGSETEFVSVGDTPRATFAKHPWSIGGGGAADLRDDIEGVGGSLKEYGADVGYHVITGEDNSLMVPPGVAQRAGLKLTRVIVEGDEVRDWMCSPGALVLWPYDELGRDRLPSEVEPHLKHLWPYRTTLRDRRAFGVPVEQRGLRWWDLREVYRQRLVTPLTIAFSEVATHNHFVLDRGGKVFKQTAPVIKLPTSASADDHLGLLGLLNSSVACFWLKQVCFPKGGDQVGGEGARVRKTLWDERYAFNATNIAEFPLCDQRPLFLARSLDTLASQVAALEPASLSASASTVARPLPTRAALDAASGEAARLRRRMIALQEEVDWRCYRLYGLLPPSTDTSALEHHGEVEVSLGERAFEIVLARRMAAGRETTAWFERHGSLPVTEIPARWPETYRQVIARRIKLIEGDRNIGLIERPEYKRRWNTPAWGDLERAALRDGLLDWLESPRVWPTGDDRPPQLTTINRLADAMRAYADFMQIAELYAGHANFDVGQVVADLVANEAVPFLPALRYTNAGLRKRAQWEETWTLQRREDASEKVGKIPVPPKYQSKDFLKTEFWRLRGGMDVPKERWVSYPGCERGADTSLPIALAGWNHLQQATALAAYYVEMKDSEGWEPIRLQPLLAGLLELVPWLEQWHNEIDPAYGERMGAYYRGFVNEEARALGLTVDDLRAWKPAVAAAKRGRKKVAQHS